MSHNDKTYKLEKVRIDTKTLTVDLEDTLFIDSDKELPATSPLFARLDLNGTLFKFKDGSKVLEIVKDDVIDLQKIKIEIDRDELMEKYQFVYDYAPIMWLDE